MRRMVKWLLGLVAVLLVLAAGGVSYVVLAYPKVPPAEAARIEATPERLVRGRYLFDHVAVCADCHSTRDFTRFGGPIVPDTIGKGGEEFNHLAGVPGRVFARNITPSAIGGWTDGELIRAVTTGVNKQGESLFPLMPYQAYSEMARDDVEAIVAYTRTLTPIANAVPARSLDFPMQLVVRTLPRAAVFGARPPAADRVAYGGYLVKMASCAECHTPREQGAPVAGMTFAGGSAFQWPWGGTVHAANLTPDADTGLGTWTEDQFVQKFKAFENGPDQVLAGADRGQNTIMPWKAYAGMTAEDLGAIYAFLRTQKPIVHRVEKFTK